MAVATCQHDLVSSLGLDAPLTWDKARHVAATAGHAKRTEARLDEAMGSVLAESLVSLVDDPVVDSAEFDGFAFRGEGPWLIDEISDVLSPGHAFPVHAGQALPHHCDAVIPAHETEARSRADGRLMLWGLDGLTGLPDETARPAIGVGIVRQGEYAQAGTRLLEMGAPVTPGVLATAAAAGHDELVVWRPPVVGVLVLGATLLDRGLPRQNRVRDALGHTVAAFVAELGARGNPAVRAPETEELLLREIDDSSADLLITTGATDPGATSLLRRVLRDLDAHWLVDGIRLTPGADALLVRLLDGRLLLGLPGNPVAALAALSALGAPLIGALRGEPALAEPPQVDVQGTLPDPDVEGDAVLAPCTIEHGSHGLRAVPCDPVTSMSPAAHLAPWGTANGLVIAHDGGVAALDPWGRPWR